MPPVEDYPVHPSTKIGPDHRSGCHGHKPFAKGYFVQDRIYSEDGTWTTVQVWAPHVLSTDCAYDDQKHPHCEGCPWIKGQ